MFIFSIPFMNGILVDRLEVRFLGTKLSRRETYAAFPTLKFVPFAYI